MYCPGRAESSNGWLRAQQSQEWSVNLIVATRPWNREEDSYQWCEWKRTREIARKRETTSVDAWRNKKDKGEFACAQWWSTAYYYAPNYLTKYTTYAWIGVPK